MIVWMPAVYSSAGTTITVPTLPDLKNGILLAVASAWCTGNISPNPMPYINGIGFSRNGSSFTTAVLQQENGIVGESTRLSLASVASYLVDPDPGAYNITITVSPVDYYSYGLVGAMAVYMYNAEYSTFVAQASSGLTYSDATLSWSTPPPKGSIFIGSCVAGDGGSSGDVITPTADVTGAGLKIDLGSNPSAGQAGGFGGGDTLSTFFDWTGSARYAAAGIGAISNGIAPWFF